MNEIAKNELFYIISMITEEQTSNIKFDEEKQRYFIDCKLEFTFTEKQFKALKLAKKELI